MSNDVGDLADGRPAFSAERMGAWADQYEAAASAQAAIAVSAGRPPPVPLLFDLLLVEEADCPTYTEKVESMSEFVEALRPQAQFIRTRLLVAPCNSDGIDYTAPDVAYKMMRNEDEPDEDYDEHLWPCYESNKEWKERKRAKKQQAGGGDGDDDDEGGDDGGDEQEPDESRSDSRSLPSVPARPVGDWKSACIIA